MKLIRAFVIVVLLVGSQTALADLQQTLNDSLGQITGASGGTMMGNVTAPQIGESAQAGYVSGGSLTTRFKIYDPNIIGFQQPYLKAGCSGIDMYGGSFSFINAEEFKNLLRSIGSNALGYAFKLGIDSMCNQCGNLMSDFQEKVQKLNEYMGNSCQLAQGLVTGGQKALQNSMDNDISLANSAMGVSADAWDGFNSYMSSGQTEAQVSAGSASEQVVTETIEGNMVWRALKGGAIQFNNGDDQLYRSIMSLTGTVIVKPRDGQTEDGSATRKVVSESKESLISLKDFVESSEMTIYTCEGETSPGEDDCKTLGSETVQVKGMAAMIDEILIGDATDPGLVSKFNDPAATLDADEELLLALTNDSGFGVMLRQASVAGDGYAKQLISGAGKSIGLLFAYGAADQMIEASILGLESYTTLSEDAKKAQDELKQRQAELRTEYATLSSTYGGVSELGDRFNHIMRLAHTPSPLFYD